MLLPIPRALLRALLRRMLGLHTSWVEFSAEYDRAAASQRAQRAQPGYCRPGRRRRRIHRP